MKVLVCGDRNWKHRYYLDCILDDINVLYGIDEIIEGCANGADRDAGWPCPVEVPEVYFHRNGWAERRRIAHRHFPADWKRYGKAAGPIRNQQMLDEGKPDMVIAFHENFNDSKGTKNMVEIARKAGIPTLIFPSVHVPLGFEFNSGIIQIIGDLTEDALKDEEDRRTLEAAKAKYAGLDWRATFEPITCSNHDPNTGPGSDWCPYCRQYAKVERKE